MTQLTFFVEYGFDSKKVLEGSAVLPEICYGDFDGSTLSKGRSQLLNALLFCSLSIFTTLKKFTIFSDDFASQIACSSLEALVDVDKGESS